MTILRDYTEVLDYVTAIEKEYSHYGIYCEVEIYYRIIFDDYKVRLIVPYEA